MANFTYSARGLALTKQFEGLELRSYQDSGGVWTVGYGHTGPHVAGMLIDEAMAEALLESDVAAAVHFVNQVVTAPITQNEFDALVDFAFNLGCAALASSHLLRLLNAGDVAGSAAQFQYWNHVHGKVVDGLTRRREAERALFIEKQGIYIHDSLGD